LQLIYVSVTIPSNFPTSYNHYHQLSTSTDTLDYYIEYSAITTFIGYTTTSL